MEAIPDQLVPRFRPDPDLVARAQRLMMDEETHAERFLRQRWEHALGSARVALDSLREIWPSEQASLAEGDRSEMDASLRLAEDLVLTLDRLSETMLGPTMVQVLMGEVTKPEEVADLRDVLLNDKQVILAKACEQPLSPPIGASDDDVGALIADGWLEWRGGMLHPTPKALDAHPGFTELA